MYESEPVRFNFVSAVHDIELQKDIEENVKETTVDYTVVADEQEALRDLEKDMYNDLKDHLTNLMCDFNIVSSVHMINVADLFTHMVDYKGDYNMEDVVEDYVNNYVDTHDDQALMEIMGE